MRQGVTAGGAATPVPSPYIPTTYVDLYVFVVSLYIVRIYVNIRLTNADMYSMMVVYQNQARMRHKWA
jgi:hypothetical protein